MGDHFPDPLPTPDGPTYEGRLLDRPDEEVVDQGVRFDLRTLMGRRALIGIGIAGLGAVALAACAPRSSASTPAATASASAGDLPSGEIPHETAGPYPADGSNGPDVLEQSGIVRSDIRSSIGAASPVDGVPLEFSLTITDMANGDVPFEGAAVYAWHCDAQGRYSMYSEGVEDETWLRGVQVTGADGTVTFASIMPGCYAGRWTHIHFEVYPDVDAITDSANAIATSQLAFPESVLTPVYEKSAYDGSAQNLAQITLESDNVFGEDGGELQLATVTGDAGSGFTASLVARVDTTTEPTSGGAPERRATAERREGSRPPGAGRAGSKRIPRASVVDGGAP